ncbi:putative chaperone protein [Roseiarcus fermentans]|uniref:Putative chaperone protein n=1 Tax=Roseiarcus fermentans TaxID=1473586 RepID=A0A366FT33_9HYPH|nr:Hsp70 family protein [Roseiarcus fermentans]RBP16869.1 putative chaperone protein [Roseiarcus fermentans]
MVPVAVGVDFGTTNSVVAIADRSGRIEVRRFETQAGAVEAYRSALLFYREGRPPNATLAHISGPDALLRAMDIDADHRFLQSLKTHLSSATLQDTYLLGQRFVLEELIGVFLSDVFPEGLGDLPVVCGRPVVFAGDRPNEGLALERLTAAWGRAGVTQVDFAYEPLGAAYWYARTIQRPETVLVADFGGGTSDFSVMRFEPGGARARAEALAHAGVGVAGDTFDFRIVDNLVSPRLGKGAHYRSFGKLLPLPARYHAAFAQWHRLSLLKDPRTLTELRRLAKQAERPAEIEDLVHLIEMDLGYELYLAVSRAKVRLSTAERTTFHFKAGDLDIAAEVTRADFERWIAADVARIGDAIDLALERAGVAVGAVDSVFMTGGTSYVPAVRTLFEQRFGRERLRYGDAFNSVASGLAAIAADSLG